MAVRLRLMIREICFLLTSKEKVQIEFDLYTTVYSLKRLINIEDMEVLFHKVENYSWNRA